MLLLRRRRHHRSGNVVDVVAALRDKAAHALGPQRRQDAGGAPAPVVTDMRSALDLKRVHELEEIMGKSSLLARAWRLGFEKAGRPVAPQIGNDDSIARVD